MYKACSRCGKVHNIAYKCHVGREKVDYSKYKHDTDKLRNTAKWAKKSQEIREQAQYLCEVCRDKGIYNYRDLEVHHITKLREDKTGLLDNSNLVCLCIKHHKQADRGQLNKEYLRELARRRIERG